MEQHTRRGYLNEDFRLFHIKDQHLLELEYHYHEFDKVVFFLSGSVTYVMEGKAYYLKPWDVLLVPHNCIHRTIIDAVAPYERVVLWMQPEYLMQNSAEAELHRCFALAKRRSFHLIRLAPAARPPLLEKLSAIEQAQSSPEFGSGLMARTSFLQFMVLLNRIAARDATQYDTAAYRSNPRLSEVIAYINENPSADLSLEALSKRFFLSKSYLMHNFKEMTGCTAHGYIRQKRLMYAAELLRRGTPVLEAGRMCGFGDYSSFLRAFKAMFGVTPGSMF